MLGERLGTGALTMLYAGLMRTAVQRAVRSTAIAPSGYSAAMMLALPVKSHAAFANLGAPPDPSPCNLTGTQDEAQYWSEWLISRIASGAQLPGMNSAFTSIFDVIFNSAGATDSLGAAVARQATSASARATGIIGALLFLLQYMSVSVDLNPDPADLHRTMSDRIPGNPGTVVATLSYELSGSHSNLDGGQGMANCLLELLNVLGIPNASLPQDGPIPGAELIFTGKDGFGDWVEFTEASEIKQSTNDSGQATIHLQGTTEPFQIPDGAPDYPRPYTIGVEAQVEPENERSLLTMFADSVLGVSGESAGGLISPVIDTMRTIHWDLGDYQMPFFDWQVGWKLQNDNPIGPITGLKCDAIDKPWVASSNPTIIAGGATVSEHQTWTVTITDTQALTGTYDYESKQVAGGITVTGSAHGSVTLVINAEGALMTLAPSTLTIHSRAGTTTGKDGGWHFQWQPTLECPRPGS